MILQLGDSVDHKLFGLGEVILDRGKTVIVRFDQGIEECEKTTLTPLASLEKNY